MYSIICHCQLKRSICQCYALSSVGVWNGASSNRSRHLQGCEVDASSSIRYTLFRKNVMLSSVTVWNSASINRLSELQDCLAPAATSGTHLFLPMSCALLYHLLLCRMLHPSRGSVAPQRVSSCCQRPSSDQQILKTSMCIFWVVLIPDVNQLSSQMLD